MTVKALLVTVVSVIILALSVSGGYAAKTLPIAGGKGYIQCKEGKTVLTKKGEVLQCILAVPLTYNVYGGTDVCPENATIMFDYDGSVIGCTVGKKSRY
ncbi:hypothetical protein [Candidatus Magnetominusculus xianensis]|uniref:Secreted protein n=1 Tax=Candidatus Magnetominusculus xianensis TaxID=1748249 RepID=A0ABR5SFT4_9BACT|nr:hypothetical protein [Candidatus Magnetominusculus xianensis]KWT86786.1 hypothetical protein ASN18_1509 [Candidatus Magnetominusculus xianensis]MBF0402496.1 hypothetical protein [Nitrospirota bacterium]